jgi:uncharacterized membrane protein YdbT with pleckstrin-like domain
MERVTYLKVRQSTISLAVRIAGLTGFLVMFWLLKSWFFGFLGDLTGIDFFTTIAGVDFLFWVSIIVYGIMVLGVLVKWYSVTYEVFTDRIAIRQGILSRNALVVSLSDFSQFQVNQGIVGRLFGYGTIEFMYRTIGPTGGFGEVFYNIHDPDELGRKLRSLMQLSDETGTASTVETDDSEKRHSEDAEAVAVAVMESDNMPDAAADRVEEVTGFGRPMSEDGSDEQGSQDGELSGEIQF